MALADCRVGGVLFSAGDNRSQRGKETRCRSLELQAIPSHPFTGFTSSLFTCGVSRAHRRRPDSSFCRCFLARRCWPQHCATPAWRARGRLMLLVGRSASPPPRWPTRHSGPAGRRSATSVIAQHCSPLPGWRRSRPGCRRTASTALPTARDDDRLGAAACRRPWGPGGPGRAASWSPSTRCGCCCGSYSVQPVVPAVVSDLAAGARRAPALARAGDGDCLGLLCCTAMLGCYVAWSFLRPLLGWDVESARGTPCSAR